MIKIATSTRSILSTKSAIRNPSRISIKVLITILMGVFVVVWLYPILLGIITSLKTDADFLQSPLSLPSQPSLKAYADILGILDFGKLLGNSFLYSFLGTTLAILLAIFPTYALSRFHIPGGDFVFILLLTGLMVPQQTVIIGLFDLLDSIGLLDSLLGLIIVHGIYGIPYVMLILRGYVVGIPKDLEMAARVDGCSDFQVLRYIIFPCLIPGIAVAGTLNFISIWNELFFALILLDSQNLFPVSVGLTILRQGKWFVSWNLPMAAAILSQLPIVILYIVAYRYIKDGLFSGAIKG